MQENGDDCGVFVCKVVCKRELYDIYVYTLGISLSKNIQAVWITQNLQYHFYGNQYSSLTV